MTTPSTHDETERKFDVHDDNVGTALDVLGGAAALGATHSSQIASTYYDTPDGQLSRHLVELRRRSGTGEEGWQLKLPAIKSSRLEVGLPLDSGDEVPDELLDQVRAYVRHRQVQPVATIHTDRTERSLLDDGVELALIADDVVRADRFEPGAVEVTSWRELEIELVEGTEDLLDDWTRLLGKAGFEPSRYPSKLHHAMGEPSVSGQHAENSASAGAVVVEHLRIQVDELLRRDREARSKEAEGVHKMRVATRRLRSALATFRPLFDRATTEPIRDELKWLGSSLGDLRDVQVQRAKLTTAVRDLPVELRVGPVTDRIDVELGRRRDEAHGRLLEALESERYYRLLDNLDRLVAEPPLDERAAGPAKIELARLVRRSMRRVHKRAADVESASESDERDRALHEVRKAAKRARYAGEATETVLRKPARRMAKRMEQVQDLLGEVQDTVMLRTSLRQIAMNAHLAQENAFTFGILYGQQACLAEQELRDYPARLKKALHTDV